MKDFFKATMVATAMLALAGWSAAANATLLFTFTGDCSTATCFGSTYTLKIGDAGDKIFTTYDAQLS